MMKDATNNEHGNSFVSYEKARKQWRKGKQEQYDNAVSRFSMTGQLYVHENCDYVTFRKISGAHGYEQTLVRNGSSLRPVTPVRHRMYGSLEEATGAEPLWYTMTEDQKELYKSLYPKGQ